MRTAMYNPILCGSPGHTEIENVSHYSNNKYSILGNFLWSGQQHNYSASQPNDLPIYVDVVVVVVAWRKVLVKFGVKHCSIKYYSIIM